MDDQVEETHDDRLSFIDAFRQLIQFAELDESRKEYFLALLTDARYGTMTVDEAAELMEIVAKTQDQIERRIIDSNDPEMINGLTQLKEFTYSLMNEAEEKGYRMVLGDKAMDTSDNDQQKPGQWLLDKFAGLLD